MEVLERLIHVGASPRLGVPVQDVLDKVRLYPAMLVHAVIGTVATRRRRDTLLIKLSTEVMGSIMAGTMIRLPACQIVHPYRVLDNNWVKTLPRWNGYQSAYAASHLLKMDVRALVEELVPDDYMDTFHGYEYRMSLLHERTNATYPVTYRAGPGEYIGDRNWSWVDRDTPLAEIAFREAGQHAADWPWISLLEGEATYDQVLIDHRAILKQFKSRSMR